jgi:hypothetical protein
MHLFLSAGEPNNYFTLNQQCVAAYTLLKRYNYFTGSDTNVDANYVALGGNGLDNLLGWADEECSKEYAYICEFTGRLSGACKLQDRKHTAPPTVAALAPPASDQNPSPTPPHPTPQYHVRGRLRHRDWTIAKASMLLRGAGAVPV